MSPFWELERFGDAPALFDSDGQAISYAQLAARADAAVADLPSRSVFALEFEPTCAAVAVYIGALRRGHPPLLLDADLTAPLKAALFERFRIQHAFDGRSWRRLAADGGAAAVPHPELRLLMSTSGSTGSPKLVRLSGDNLSANAASIAAYMGLEPADRAITALPLHYSYGLSVLNSHLAIGAATALNADAVVTQEFWRRVRELGVTGLAGVPATWRMLRRLGFERMALPSLRLMSAAGGRLEPAEIAWLARVASSNGRRFFSMYGQTEATARIAYLPHTLAETKPGSIGQAIPGGALRLLGPDGAEIDGPDIEGELAYSGPNVMLGYAEAPEDLARGRDVSELHTGDLARRDLDGHFWITGRRSRVVKLFGLRFSLDDVEAQMRSWGLDAAVLGEDDRLIVAVAGIGALRGEELRLKTAAHYRVHPSVVSVVSVTAIPRSSAGKVLYAALRAQISGATAQP